MDKILKYTPLFPIYFILNPRERGDLIKVAITQGLILFIIMLAVGKGVDIESNHESVGNQSFTLNTEEERLGVNVESAFDKLKELQKVEEKVEPVFASGYSRISVPPDDIEMQMAKEYYEIMNKTSEKTGIPIWTLIGVSVMEGGSLYTKNPPIPGTSMPYNLYGQEGLNFTNYGYEQISKGLGDRAAGSTDGVGVAGPFKMKMGSWDSYGEDNNNDGIADRYNFADASLGAANMIKSLSDNLGEIPVGTHKDIVGVWTTGAYNAGPGGMLARVPKDSIEEFLSYDIAALVNDTNLQVLVYETYMSKGRGWAMRKPILEFWDSLGWSMDKTLTERVNKNIPDMNITQEIGQPNPGGSWPGDLKGNRDENGYKTSKSEYEVMSRYDSNGNRMSMNMETLEYLVAAYSIGNLMAKELEFKITGQEIIPKSEFNVSRSNKTLSYLWQDRSMDNLSNTQKTKVEGLLGEVGWKGNFPLFIQGVNSNYNSNLDWKFNGRSTNLGRSGCSIFSLTSMIHGAGLGEEYIPGTSKLPTIENIAKEFPNGPVIYSDVIRKGYKVSLRSTKTKNDLDVLFEDIKAGIPYVVNTKSGKIKGMTRDGKIVNTEFTSGGHFLILVSAYEVGDKRYVEVVQTTRSNAGTRDIDQNEMSFDYDELIEKNILRSSGGHPVSAYTIVGIDGKTEANYLAEGYTAPKANKDQLTVVESTGNTRKRNVIKDVVVNKNLIELEKYVRPTGDMTPNIDLVLKEKALLMYDGLDAIIFLDYNNAILISNLENTLIYQGVVEENVIFGTTTDLTTYNFVTKVGENEWKKTKELIQVTED